MNGGESSSGSLSLSGPWKKCRPSSISSKLVSPISHLLNVKSSSRSRGPAALAGRAVVGINTLVLNQTASCSDFGRKNNIAALDRRLVQKFYSTQSTPALQTIQDFKGLHKGAQCENFKKEQYQERIARSRQAGAAASSKIPTKGGVDVVHDSSGLSVEVLEETFSFEFQQCGEKLDEMRRAIRCEATHEKGPTDRAEEMDREERRRRAERERKLRDAEKDARDPKKKIALRLETGREFGGDHKDVPMQWVNCNGPTGPEKIKMVDVVQIQNRCMLLDQSPTVDSLLELNDHKEKLKVWAQQDNSASVTDFLNANRGRKSLMHRTTVQNRAKMFVELYEQRQKLAAGRRRSRWQEQQDICHERFQQSVRNSTQPEAGWSSGQRTTRPRMLSNSFDHSHGSVGPLSPGSIKSSEMMSPKHSLSPKTSKIKKGFDSSSGSMTANVPEKPIVTQAWLSWGYLWRVVKVWRVLHLVRTKKHAIEVVKSFLNQMSESVKIRASVYRYIENLKKLQRQSKNFLNLKRKRVELMTKIWIRVEDQYLSSYFKTYGARIMAEEMKRREKEAQTKGAVEKSREMKKAATRKECMGDQNNGMPAGLVAFNWKQFRIPAERRKLALGRFYGRRLNGHMTASRQWASTVTTAYKAQIEFLRFLKSFGDGHNTITKEELDDAMPPPVAPKAEFWDLTDEDTLELISATARTMRNVDPFQDHPANKDLAQEPVSKNQGESRILSRKPEPTKQASKIGGLLGRASLVVRFGGASSSSEPQLNVEGLWANFSPRLKQIVDSTEEPEPDVVDAAKKAAIKEAMIG